MRSPLWWYAAGVGAANLAIRGAWVALVHPEPTSDYQWYFRAASDLAAGAGYVDGEGEPTAYWPVGWPFALSLLFRMTGPSVAAGLALQVVLSAATALLVVLLAHRLSGSPAVALAAGVAYTVLPAGWAWDSQLGSEQLFTLLAVATLYLLSRADRWQWYAAGGVACGLACLVRPVLLPLPALVLLIELTRRGWRNWRPALAYTVVFGAALALTIAPWTARNAAVLGEPVPVSTNGGINLYQGTRTPTGYWWSRDPRINPLVGIPGEVERHEVGTRLALEHWRAHPDQLVRDAPARIKALYASNDTPFMWLHVFHGWAERDYLRWRMAADVVYWLVALCAVVGLAAAVRHRRFGGWLLGGFVLYYTALWLFFPAWDRFRYPLMPALAVLAGMALLHLPAVRARAARSDNAS